MGTLQNVLTAFDHNNYVNELSGTHKRPFDQNEIEAIVKELQQMQVFRVIPNRRHLSFQNPTNIVCAKPVKHSVDWIVSHLHVP